jgi:diguanylate cyclase (GGDEF)-like protein/PAS domain S-box-containing protein
MMREPTEYNIVEVSEKLGIPVQTLRRWDQQQVLIAQRTTGGHRRYSREFIDNLAKRGGASAVNTGASEELETIKKALNEKRRIIQLLLESESRYRDLVETSHELIFSTDYQGRFTYLNSAAEGIFALSPQRLLGRCLLDFESRPSYVANRRFWARLKREEEVKNYLTHIVSADGKDRWIEISARTSVDEHGTMIGTRGSIRDITKQHLASLKAEFLAFHDSLTDLPNRAALHQALEKAMTTAAVGAILFLDIDHFKYVNDNFGHKAGDQFIVGVAGVLRDSIRDTDACLYRLGGDEFAVHVPDCLRSDAVRLAIKLQDAVRLYHYKHKGSKRITTVTISIGIALYPFHGSDLGVLLANADIAMYQAKDSGRNRYVLFESDLQNARSTHRRVHWAQKLRDAIHDDRLILYSQPVVRLTDLQPVHHEVLVRIQEEDGNIVAPTQFIEAAESLNLVQEIDLRVIEKLIKHIVDGPGADKKLRYSMNLSRVSISDPHWVSRFHRILVSSPVRPDQLVFEITETAAMSDIDITVTFIKTLKDMGCRFALDDFGAGFSSFYYLKRFEVDYLKIDGNFVRDLATDEGNRVFVRALSDIAKGLNKQVIAEWVETDSVRQTLLNMGTEYGQGFLFGQPSPLSKGKEKIIHEAQSVSG